MKLLITESQKTWIVQHEQAQLLMEDILSESKNLDILKRKMKNLILMGFAGALIINIINNDKTLANSEKQELINFVENEENVNSEEKFNSEEYQRKVDAVENYMTFALSNLGYSRESTKLSAEALVDASYKYSFDLPLLMAVAHQESCFGATPRAKRTNSVFSVGSYDNGKNVATYAHPNDSVESYIKLLNSDYLINGKTINDLLQPGSFVNKNGHRYASDNKYESNLKNIRNKILKRYPFLV